MNFIVIVSDTLRRDYLPCYGNPAVFAPNLTAFARRSLVFDQARPSSFPTVPARADLMTGKYTFTYLDWGPLPQDEVTLAGCFSQAGYRTFGIADTPFLVRNGYGLDRGFQDFIEIRGQRGGPTLDDVNRSRSPHREEDRFAPMTLKGAADWIERNSGQDFFLYVDTWDPHEPWDPPAHYVKRYLPDYAGENVRPAYWDYREAGVTERDLEIARACYSGEISMVDHWFGYLINRLEVMGLMENSAILFTSDHGFYFGEHGMFGKRRFRWPDNSEFEEGFAKGYTLDKGYTFRSPLHSEITRIPMLFYVPGYEPRRIPALVTLPDIMPTFLDLAGIARPASVQARSLLPLMQGQVDALHDFVVTCAPFEDIGRESKTVDDQTRIVKEISPATISDGEWDLLYSVSGEPAELYRAQEDPGHLNNVIGRHRAAAEKLHAAFFAWLARSNAPQHVIEARRSLD